MTPNEAIIPDAPSFSEETVQRCRETADYRPMLFEWYKFVGTLNTIVAHIQRDSPAFRSVPALHYYVLVGLLNRCARLMLSNVALSYEGKFGETTAIVDRCIFESAVKITWLCTDPSEEKFRRFLADGLQTELELKARIETNISGRDGRPFPIETRMLASIENHVAAAQLTESEVGATKKLPDLASMLSSLGTDRLIYVVAQKIGSHHVHGTWPALLFHYLDEAPSGSRTFVPRGHDCSTHVNQYVFVPKVILGALSVYVEYALQDAEAETFKRLFESTEQELDKVNAEVVGGDFRAV